MANKAKLLGDHTMQEFIRDVRVSTLLGMPSSFVFVSTLSSLSLELDPQGPETVLIIGIRNSSSVKFSFVGYQYSCLLLEEIILQN
jgi:hypothetical protein